MMSLTPQMKVWAGEFGKAYTDRNSSTPEELDQLYINRYGISRTELNSKFLSDVSDIDHSIRILEVGANIGTQLSLLQLSAFSSLWGIELQWYAVELSKQRTQHINILQGSAFDLPFKDGYFDLVFTSGVLIHIDPKNISNIIQEIYRCTRKYIWGFEYWSERYTEVAYREHQDLLWKADYAKLYQQKFSDLVLVKEEHYFYLDNPDLVDTMFLLRKR